MRSDAPAPGGPASPPLVRSTQWAGLRTGSRVEVGGVRGRSTSWAFLAHVRNERTGEEWVEVVGGKTGRRAIRSFPPGQIFPHSTARGSGRRAGKGSRGVRRQAPASFADAPQLPL